MFYPPDLTFVNNTIIRSVSRFIYFNCDFTGATSTFMYISKHFTWLPDVVTEARIWEALATTKSPKIWNFYFIG